MALKLIAACFNLNTTMKKLLLFILLLSAIMFAGKKADAQSYQTAIGGKFGGYENGLSIKYFTQKAIALEGILGFRSHGIIITGLYEIHQTAFSLPDLKFYYGAGAHIGSIGSGKYERFGSSDQDYHSNQLLLGADAVLGLEYVIPKAPIAVSIDLNPRLELATGPFFDIAPGVGIKYTF